MKGEGKASTHTHKNREGPQRNRLLWLTSRPIRVKTPNSFNCL